MPIETCEKVANANGNAVVFAGYSGFLHHLQLASEDIAAGRFQHSSQPGMIEMMRISTFRFRAIPPSHM